MEIALKKKDFEKKDSMRTADLLSVLQKPLATISPSAVYSYLPLAFKTGSSPEQSVSVSHTACTVGSPKRATARHATKNERSRFPRTLRDRSHILAIFRCAVGETFQFKVRDSGGAQSL